MDSMLVLCREPRYKVPYFKLTAFCLLNIRWKVLILRKSHIELVSWSCKQIYNDTPCYQDSWERLLLLLLYLFVCMYVCLFVFIFCRYQHITLLSLDKRGKKKGEKSIFELNSYYQHFTILNAWCLFMETNEI